MSELIEFEQSIRALLDTPPFALAPERRHEALLALLKQELGYACDRNPRYRNYVRHWPVSVNAAETIADLPYLPVAAFKSDPPLTLVPENEIKRTLTSSATSGQLPSRVVLDAATSRRVTKGFITIVRDFIGPARRPYLVVDTPENLRSQPELGARGAAIQALMSFTSETAPCLRLEKTGETGLDLQMLLTFADRWKEAEVLVYGFTSMIWTHLAQPLQRRGVSLSMPNIRVLHSGGWKRLEHQAVTKDVFIHSVASVFGCSEDRVIDFYGMVENVGVVYPDCESENKHVPAFADVIVRDPITLRPVGAGGQGVLEVCSVLPTSFPGFLLLTEDIAELIGHDGCPCGRRGTHFRFLRRVPKAELRGCGNLEASRGAHREVSAIHA